MAFRGDEGPGARQSPRTDALRTLPDSCEAGPGSRRPPVPFGRERRAPSSLALSTPGDNGSRSESSRQDSDELRALRDEAVLCLGGKERSSRLPSSPEPLSTVVLNRTRELSSVAGARRRRRGGGHWGVLHSRGRRAPQGAPWRRRRRRRGAAAAAAPRGGGDGDGDGDGDGEARSGGPSSRFSFSTSPRRVRRLQGRAGRLPRGCRRRLSGGEKSGSSEGAERALELAEAALEPAEVELKNRLRS